MSTSEMSHIQHKALNKCPVQSSIGKVLISLSQVIQPTGGYATVCDVQQLAFSALVNWSEVQMICIWSS